MQPLVHEKKLINKLCHAFAAGALPWTHRVSAPDPQGKPKVQAH